jgi:hypothetical protein
VPGVQGEVDVNAFGGSVAEWRAWLAQRALWARDRAQPSPALARSEACPLHPIAQKIEEADVAVSARGRAAEPPSRHQALGQVSEIADQPPMFTLGALVLAGGTRRRHAQRRARRGCGSWPRWRWPPWQVGRSSRWSRGPGPMCFTARGATRPSSWGPWTRTTTPSPRATPPTRWRRRGRWRGRHSRRGRSLCGGGGGALIQVPRARTTRWTWPGRWWAIRRGRGQPPRARRAAPCAGGTGGDRRRLTAATKDSGRGPSPPASTWA